VKNVPSSGEFVADNCSLQQQLANLQEAQKEVLQFLKERDKQVARLESELQNVRQQTVTAQDLAQGLQLENARYGSFSYRCLLLLHEPKGEEVTGGWRELHSEKLHNLYCSLNIII
jgi:hypothetical protein